MNRHARNFAEQIDILTPIGLIDIDHGIGTEGRYDASVPIGIANGAMMQQRIGGGIGGCQRFDIEAIEQCPRTKCFALQLLGNCIVDYPGVGAIKLEFDVKDIGDFIAGSRRRSVWRGRDANGRRQSAR